MAHRLPLRTAATIALAIATIPAAAIADPAANNRTMGSSHEPVVSRTDFTLDLVAGPNGLATGETQRLAGWFDGLMLGYGDTVTLDRGWSGGRSADAIATVLARYGMLVAADPAPANAGHAPPGAVRVVVSRAIARVEGCPDWSRGNYADYEGTNTSNFGCSTAQNFAAMIANPQDLVQGRHGRPGGDAAVTVRAIKSYRDAKNTGDGGLPGGVTSVSIGGKK